MRQGMDINFNVYIKNHVYPCTTGKKKCFSAILPCDYIVYIHVYST